MLRQLLDRLRGPTDQSAVLQQSSVLPSLREPDWSVLATVASLPCGTAVVPTPSAYSTAASSFFSSHQVPTSAISSSSSENFCSRGAATNGQGTNDLDQTKVACSPAASLHDGPSHSAISVGQADHSGVRELTPRERAEYVAMLLMTCASAAEVVAGLKMNVPASNHIKLDVATEQANERSKAETSSSSEPVAAQPLTAATSSRTKRSRKIVNPTVPLDFSDDQPPNKMGKSSKEPLARSTRKPMD